MGTDDIYKKNKKAIERHVIKRQRARSQKWLFVCEGSKTEPKYIKSLVEWCNSLSEREPIKVTACGDGRNTESLVRSVEEFVCDVESCKAEPDVFYEKVFVLFDKDSFGKDKFDNAISMSRVRGYIPIWSNECFELWFLLHFMLYSSDNGRDEYYKKLSDILKINYVKNKAMDVFSKIHTSDGLKKAYKHAKKLIKECSEEQSESKMVPCTQLPVLIDELETKLNIKIV